jgi:hypothetical protein
MLGLIFRVADDLVTELGGDEAAVDARGRAGFPAGAPFRLDEHHEESRWRTYLGAVCETLGVSADQAEEAFSAHFVADAMRRWPMWFRMSGDSREFLARIPSIHNSLAAGLRSPAEREAVGRKFHVAWEGDELVTTYRSGNQLCGVYRRLAEAVIDHYGDRAVIEEPSCLKRGDPACVFRIRWLEEA